MVSTSFYFATEVTLTNYLGVDHPFSITMYVLFCPGNGNVQTETEKNDEKSSDEVAMKEGSNEDPKTEESKEEPKAEESKEEVKTEESKDEPKTEKSKEEPKTEESKEEANKEGESNKEEAGKRYHRLNIF